MTAVRYLPFSLKTELAKMAFLQTLYLGHEGEPCPKAFSYKENYFLINRWLIMVEGVGIRKSQGPGTGLYAKGAVHSVFPHMRVD